jgi:hypothetical protein
MAQAKSPSFVCELPLAVSPAEELVLLRRLDCARMVYNACLGESLKRLEALRSLKSYREACRMPKGTKNSPAAKERRKHFMPPTRRPDFGNTTCMPMPNSSGTPGWANIWTA